jgi:uncharacterized membrane protein YidH (DUF202 family)
MRDLLERMGKIISFDPFRMDSSRGSIRGLERTLLANETNFSVWSRTGITSLVAVLGIGKLLGSLVWPLLTEMIGRFFLISGGLASFTAFTRYYWMHDRLRQEKATVGPHLADVRAHNRPVGDSGTRKRHGPPSVMKEINSDFLSDNPYWIKPGGFPWRKRIFLGRFSSFVLGNY